MRFARNVVRLAVLMGANERGLLDRSGIDPADLEDLDGWLRGDRMTALWAAAVVETGDPDFGLRLGAQAQPGAVSLVGYLMLSADTLGDALADLAQFGPLIATVQAVRLDAERFGASAAVEMAPHASGPLAQDLRQPLEATLATFMTICRSVTGRPLPVTEVSLRHARPPTGTAVHEQVFGVRPLFGRDRYRVAFRPEALRWKARAASPVLHASFLREADRVLQALTNNVLARTARAIEARFGGSVPALGEVAAALAMSERTLQRHLADEGTTFQAVCDGVRRRLAVRLLADGDAPLGEVAGRLGYSGPSAFHRAFKRWTGQTPRAFREARTQAERRAPR